MVAVEHGTAKEDAILTTELGNRETGVQENWACQKSLPKAENVIGSTELVVRLILHVCM